MNQQTPMNKKHQANNNNYNMNNTATKNNSNAFGFAFKKRKATTTHFASTARGGQPPQQNSLLLNNNEITNHHHHHHHQMQMMMMMNDQLQQQQQHNKHHAIGSNIVRVANKRSQQHQGNNDAGPIIHQNLGVPERFHEELSIDVNEDERMLELLNIIIKAECAKAEINFGNVEENRFLYDIIHEVLHEFYLRTENALIEEEFAFDEGPNEIQKRIDEKKDSLRTLHKELFTESKQWDEMLEACATQTKEEEEQKQILEEEVRRQDEFSKQTERRGTLASACLETHRALALQAEGAAAIVQGCEALCIRAENACKIFTDAIAKNDFKNLPDVDNPHNLLQNLIGAYSNTIDNNNQANDGNNNA